MTAQELELQEKQELKTAEEPTTGGIYYQPYTDIHEGADNIVVSMDMPGVARGQVEVELEKDVLTVSGKVDHTKYGGLKPVYTEYNVGDFTRRFTVSNAVDREGITAKIENGVLTVVLPKVKQAVARRIEVA